MPRQTSLRRRVSSRLPSSVVDYVRRHHLSAWPPVGWARWRIGRGVRPVSRSFGYDRGRPVDRYYIEAFLGRYLTPRAGESGDLRGRVLEIGEDFYVRRFAATHVTSVDVLDVDSSNERATIVADLAAAPELPDEQFDCIICTQTLLLIFDVKAAIATLYRVLRPGGVLLVTVPGLGRLCRSEDGLWEDHWRFTSNSARRLFERQFGPGSVTVCTYGNVLSASALLYGVAVEELDKRHLEVHDADYEVLIGVRALKGRGEEGEGSQAAALERSVDPARKG